jgi:hypothetical protein
MNADERIEAALRRRPSDERTYDEPLASLAAARRERIRPVVGFDSSRKSRGLPALAAVCLAVVFGAGLLVVALPQLVGPGSGPSEPTATPTASSRPLGCMGYDTFGFSPDVLSGPDDAEKGSSPAAAVLRALLASTEGSVIPAAGWHVIRETPDEVRFMANPVDTNPGTWALVVVQRNTDGRFATEGWSLMSNSWCLLHRIPPEGYGTASWTTDASALTPDTTELYMLVTAQECRSGEEIALSNIRADVGYSSDRVVVTVFVRSPVGAQDCQGSPPTEYSVHLSEPIGYRALIDGSAWPGNWIVFFDDGGIPNPTPTPTPAPGTPTVMRSDTTDYCGPTTACMVTFVAPVVVGITDAAETRINDTISARVWGYIDDFKSNAVGCASQCTLDGTYTVVFASPSLLSLTLQMDVVLGNGYTTPSSLNFRVADGTLIGLPDLFSDDAAALAILSTESRQQLPDVLATISGDTADHQNTGWIETGTTPVVGNFDKAWAFTPQGLQITFDTAQVAGRWAGTPTVTIPWADLAGVIDLAGPAAEFLP